ncbi:MAG: hypothetical protein KGV57_01065 [Fusobacterium sp.]|nr:hypothetical protein [Fusobacterium sp.]
MIDLSTCEEKLREIAQAEEDLILNKTAYINGTEVTTETLSELKELWETRKKKIINTPISVDLCNQYIQFYLEAEKAVLAAKEYVIDGQVLKRENLKDIIRARQNWQGKRDQLLAGDDGGVKFYRVSHTGD